MKFLGVTDEITICQKCGKVNLKRTIAIELEDGSIVYYGSDCAARALKSTVKGASKSMVDSVADMIAFAQKWLKVYDLKTVSGGISNKFGYANEVKGDVICVKTDAGIVEIGK